RVLQGWMLRNTHPQQGHEPPCVTTRPRSTTKSRLSATVPYMFSIDETMDIGCDRQTPVTDEYPDHPHRNRYRGTIRSVLIELFDDHVTPDGDALTDIVLGTH
ncbi:hypothetical protein, partial [Enemella sp. A6]|uniref:hypothetical protein n=1 Tax=Enemella sp. A6 TaxID=3440152 RepID=UPI003EC09DEC